MFRVSLSYWLGFGKTIRDLFLFDDVRISENKSMSLQGEITSDLFGFSFEFRPRGDHGGISFEICLLGLDVLFNLYDNRHWDYDENRWMTYEEMKEEMEDNA